LFVLKPCDVTEEGDEIFLDVEENGKDKHWGLVNVRFQIVKGKRQNYGLWRRSGLG
jgi:hypothetical protein